jgi:GNAT superfamily N-acetyltransferase
VSGTPGDPRGATVDDSGAAAGLLDAFNREFGTPTPGRSVLKRRLGRLLGDPAMSILLSGDPPIAIAVLTLRPSVWYDGPVAVLDELYVEPARRRQGVGSKLLAAAEALTVSRGGQLLEINVDGNDTDARRFYERHGYTNTDAGQLLLYYYRELRGSQGSGGRVPRAG